MIAAGRFLFIHLHKTGGQFVNRLLLRHLPGARPIGYHLPRAEAPFELRTLPAIGFVRNPWDWYVSWYAFNAAEPLRNPIFRVLSDDGQLGFGPTLDNMLHLGCEARRTLRERLIAALPAERARDNRGSGITAGAMRSFQDEDAGYFTWLARYMFAVNGTWDGMHIGRMEQLREGLLQMLAALNGPVSRELHEAIRTAPAVNASPRRDYRAYYDAGLRSLVARRDRELIERYGYIF